jgi:hypothetical protein
MKQNIYVSEAEKELSLFKENIDEENNKILPKLIERELNSIQSNDFESLKSSVENLENSYEKKWLLRNHQMI